MRRLFLVGVLGALCVSGCAGLPPAQVGQTAGTIAGAAIAPGIGAPIGALVGMLAGMVVQGELDKVTEKHERRDLSKALGTGANAGGASPPPTTLPPQGVPVRVWVDESVHEGRRVAGHFDIRYIP